MLRDTKTDERGIPDDRRDRFLPIFGWVMYDFSNTIYSALIATRYFPPYLNDLSGGDTATGMTMAGSMIVSGLIVPFLGARADRTGRTKFYLCETIFLCALSTMALFVSTSLFFVIPAFFLSNMAYQVSLVFYNSLLPEVASGKKIHKVNGIGVGVGYMGALFAFPVAHEIHSALTIRHVFLAAGMLFFFLSFPLFLFVPERRGPAGEGEGSGASPLSRVLQTLRSLPRTPRLLFFLLGNFFCVDALNTVIIYLSVYLKKGMLLSEGTITLAMVLFTVGALANGFLAGILTRSIGSLPTYLLAGGLLLFSVLLAGAGIPAGFLIPVLAVAGSFGLAGIWVAGRKYLLEIAPPERVGEFFGFYGITGKLSIVEVFLFSLLADIFSYQVAILSLGLTLLAGITLIVFAWLWRMG